MKVSVKYGEREHPIKLWAPLGAMCLGVLVPDKELAKMGVKNRKALIRLYKALKKAKKDFPGLELVHVVSADGEVVSVKL